MRRTRQRPSSQPQVLKAISAISEESQASIDSAVLSIVQGVVDLDAQIASELQEILDPAARIVRISSMALQAPADIDSLIDRLRSIVPTPASPMTGLREIYQELSDREASIAQEAKKLWVDT